MSSSSLQLTCQLVFPTICRSVLPVSFSPPIVTPPWTHNGSAPKSADHNLTLPNSFTDDNFAVHGSAFSMQQSQLPQYWIAIYLCEDEVLKLQGFKISNGERSHISGTSEIDLDARTSRFQSSILVCWSSHRISLSWIPDFVLQRTNFEQVGTQDDLTKCNAPAEWLSDSCDSHSPAIVLFLKSWLFSN